MGNSPRPSHDPKSEPSPTAVPEPTAIAGTTEARPDSWSRLLAPRGIIVTLGVGIVGTIIWEWVLQPGAVWGGREFLTLITLGSTRLVDSVYAQAAFDPTPVPDILGLMIFASVLISTMVTLLSLIRVAQRKSEALKTPEATPKVPKPPNSRLASWAFPLCLALSVFLLAPILSELFQASVAIRIWREFHTNLRVCGPYLRSEQEKSLESRFAQMTTRSEYLGIYEELRSIADQHSLTLQDWSR
jgi:hypothetical protein